MAIYNTATITIGTSATVTVADYTVDFGGGLVVTFRGYNPVIPAGSVNPTTFNGTTIRFVQWSSNFGLQIALGSDTLNNPGWDTVVVNNTSFSRSAATYSAWDGTQEGWRWSGVSNPFPTVGTFKLDFVGNNDASYGFNAAAFGSMTNTVYRDFGIQLVFHNPSNDTLSLGLNNALDINGDPINGKWGYIAINGVKYYRTDAPPFKLFGVAIFNWAGITANPFDNTASGTRTFTMGYEDPDTDVTVIVPTEIALSDTQFPVTVNGIGVTGENRYGVGLNPDDLSELTGTTPAAGIDGAATAPTSTFEITQELPTSGETRTYYLYAGRTEATGGAGGLANEGAAFWIYTGKSFQVTRSTEDNVTINPEPQPAASYGFRAYNASGNVVVEHSSRVPRFVTSGSETVGPNTHLDVDVPGIIADGTWLVFLVARTEITTGLAFFSEAIFTDLFRIFNTAEQSRTFDYWVVNIG